MIVNVVGKGRGHKITKDAGFSQSSPTVCERECLRHSKQRYAMSRDLENGIKKQETGNREHIKHRVGKKNSYSTGHVSNLPV